MGPLRSESWLERVYYNLHCFGSWTPRRSCNVLRERVVTRVTQGARVTNEELAKEEDLLRVILETFTEQATTGRLLPGGVAFWESVANVSVRKLQAEYKKRGEL